MMRWVVTMKNYTLGEKIISFLYKNYIELVAYTSCIEIKGDLEKGILRDAVIGFWHGDSFGVNFLLRELMNPKQDVSVIVTADQRGNYIERILNIYGAQALRMPDGARLRHFLNELKQMAQLPNHALGIALDGPLGPLHEPKKLGAMLAYEGDKPYVLIRVEYTRKIHLTKRWDRYAVPLPFGKMTFTGYNQGKVSKEELRTFTEYQEKIKKQLL